MSNLFEYLLIATVAGIMRLAGVKTEDEPFTWEESEKEA